MFLGIDLGTSGVKGVAVAADGSVSGQSTARLSVARPQTNWSEQEPNDWWGAVSRAVCSLAPAIRARVRGIGLAGQMHGATLLGADHRPLRPAILWNDGRSQTECGELEAAEPETRAITGNIAMPGFTAPKLLWLRKHEPDVFEKIRLVLLPKDYVRLCMTGEAASDMSDSAGTLWLNVAARDWSDAMLAATGLSRDQMPSLHEGPEPTGLLRADVASAWGMDPVPVVAGASDNAGGAAGIGIVNEGDALLSLGTSGVTFVATETLRAAPEGAVHAFCHCLPGMWHQMAVHLSAASCVDWAARQLGLPGPADIFALAERASAGNGPELFLPFLSGERTPHNDPHLRAGFLQLGSDTSPDRLASAVLEGVAFAHADGLDALSVAGTGVSALNVIGGGARSRYWGRILSSTLGVPLNYLDGGEVGPALGAAKLAMIGVAGMSVSEACTRPQVLDTVAPDPALTGLLAEKRSRFRAATAAIRSLSKGKT